MRKAWAENGTNSEAGRGFLGIGRACLLPAAYCILLSGCAGGNHKTESGDPLFGAAPTRAAGQTTPVVKPGASANGMAPPSANPATAPVPAVNTPPSTASLASGQPPRYDTDNSLRIKNPPANPTSSSSNSWQGTDAGGAVRLKGVESETPRTNFVPGSVGGSRAGSYEQAQSLLAQHGVTWQQLHTLNDGQWEFSCSVPNRQNQSLSRTYTGRGRDSLSAVQTVLDQIDKDKQQ